MTDDTQNGIPPEPTPQVAPTKRRWLNWPLPVLLLGIVWLLQTIESNHLQKRLEALESEHRAVHLAVSGKFLQVGQFAGYVIEGMKAQNSLNLALRQWIVEQEAENVARRSAERSLEQRLNNHGAPPIPLAWPFLDEPRAVAPSPSTPSTP